MSEVATGDADACVGRDADAAADGAGAVVSGVGASAGVSPEGTGPVLDEVEARVLGTLIEKERTTPEVYPLTLRALVVACNQKSNRDPVMHLDESAVVAALDRLRAVGLAWEVSEAGARVLKYRHDLAGVFPVSAEESAILCELLIRGRQTAGELRTRAGRICPLPDVASVESALARLADRPGGALVVRLPREKGCRESRFAHLLCGPVAFVEDSAATAAPAAVVGVSPSGERLARMESEIEALRAEVAALRDDVRRIGGQAQAR